MTLGKFSFFIICAVLGVLGYIYGLPIYIELIKSMGNATLSIFTFIVLICSSVIVWFFYNLLGVVDDEIEYRRCGDIKIDGEINEDFRLDNKYFHDET